MFIFNRRRRSSAAVTPVKYECDLNNLKGTLQDRQFAYGEINERGFSKSPPLVRKLDFVITAPIKTFRWLSVIPSHLC